MTPITNVLVVDVNGRRFAVGWAGSAVLKPAFVREVYLDGAENIGVTWEGYA
jgi:hypothetical protein